MYSFLKNQHNLFSMYIVISVLISTVPFYYMLNSYSKNKLKSTLVILMILIKLPKHYIILYNALNQEITIEGQTSV